MTPNSGSIFTTYSILNVNILETSSTLEAAPSILHIYVVTHTFVEHCMQSNLKAICRDNRGIGWNLVALILVMLASSSPATLLFSHTRRSRDCDIFCIFIHADRHHLQSGQFFIFHLFQKFSKCADMLVRHGEV